MSKVTLGRIFDVSRYITTDAGKQLKDALAFISDFAELTLRNLRNGLTFVDNVDCVVKTISMITNAEEIIEVPGSKRVTQVMVRRILDDQYYVYNGFGWRYTKSGQLAVTIDQYSGLPRDYRVTVELLIFY